MSGFELSDKVLGCAFRVHTALGPGLLESSYQVCLVYELKKHGIRFEAEKEIPIIYDGQKMDAKYRVDLLVEDKLILELKSVETLLPIHEAQLLTYLKLAKIKTGLLLNFNVVSLKNGIKRLSN
jgi:GxxExxY protein